VVVTRRAEQAAVLGEKFCAAGFQPLLFPTITLEALPAPDLDQALAEIENFDWLIFSSANAVRFFFRRLDGPERSPALPRTAVVGPATARALQAQGIAADFMPDSFTGEALAQGLGQLAGQHILLPRARIGGAKIVESLLGQGAQVTDIALYDTVTAAPEAAALAELARGYEAITFTSPSSVRGFLQISGGKPLAETVVACIGPVTAAAAAENGLSVTLVPDEYTLDGLVQILSDYFGEKSI
jgi:uroporphyrinogen III methyltransferase/synthase